ncbi:hypothetical protein HY498_00920 [Candidatus Woesearchaeota archaeon]|nr:hypothetical protein [Candidatus Woesearchaeota archaeon]
MEELITFEYLYDVLRKEKYAKELQKLDDNFLSNLKKYITEKTKILLSQTEKNSIFSAAETIKTRKQLDNVQKLIKELFERRESKILHLAFVASKVEGKHHLASNLVKEEEILFKDIIQKLNEFRNLTIIPLLDLETIEDSKPKDIKIDIKAETKTIKVLEPIPQFIGEDMQVYGPFNQKEKAVLPVEIAELLIERKIAELENEIT